MQDLFRKLAQKVSLVVGAPATFMLAVIVVLIWAVSGPVFAFSDTWQLVINTGTTIVTFLMVFLIQNTQNRDAKAVHLKLDELIRATKTARDEFLILENMSDEEIAQLEKDFMRLHDAKADTPLMHKLHENIKQVRSRRNRLREAGVAINNFLRTPLYSRDNDIPKK